MIIYKEFDNQVCVWCRPLKMFLSPVDKEKYPNIKQSMRFERIDENER